MSPGAKAAAPARAAVTLAALALGAAGCPGGNRAESSAARDAQAGAAAAPDARAPSGAALARALAAGQPVPLPLPPYPPSVRSLRLRRSVAVHLGPSEATKRLGTVARDTRVGYGSAWTGAGCDARWIEIEPRGWVCEAYLEPQGRAPDGVELPRLEHGELVPGTYGKLARGAEILTWDGKTVTARTPLQGAATVRQYGEADIEGKHYWRIESHRYALARLITPHVPSQWHGTRLGDDTGRSLPLGFAMDRRRPLGWVSVYPTADATRPARRIAMRTRVDLLETARGEDGTPRAYRIGDGAWLQAGDVRIARLTPPPPTTRPHERWIDVDLDAQVLVAYEGARPVYATLVSSGKKKTPTATGIYRIWVKFAETDMSGQMADEEAYSVATVPWTQYFAIDLALHTAYWHDKFGTPRSHGCINLSPIDARFLYFWSQPDMPRGWSMVHGLVERPGSMVRVRSAADPEPAFQGYAMRVYQARRAAAEARAERGEPASARSDTVTP